MLLQFRKPIYMPMNMFKNERMRRGGTCRRITDLVRSCSSADVTWARVGGSGSSPAPWEDPDQTPETRASRSPTTSHSHASKCARHFVFPPSAAACAWTCCAFLRSLYQIQSYLRSSVSWTATGRSKQNSHNVPLWRGSSVVAPHIGCNWFGVLPSVLLIKGVGKPRAK